MNKSIYAYWMDTTIIEMAFVFTDHFMPAIEKKSCLMPDGW